MEDWVHSLPPRLVLLLTNNPADNELAVPLGFVFWCHNILYGSHRMCCIIECSLAAGTNSGQLMWEPQHIGLVNGLCVEWGRGGQIEVESGMRPVCVLRVG